MREVTVKRQRVFINKKNKLNGENKPRVKVEVKIKRTSNDKSL